MWVRALWGWICILLVCASFSGWGFRSVYIVLGSIVYSISSTGKDKDKPTKRDKIGNHGGISKSWPKYFWARLPSYFE